MRKEAGNSLHKTGVTTPEIKSRFGPSEIQHFIAESHITPYQEQKTIFKKYSLVYFEEYKNSPEGIETIKVLKRNIEDLTTEEISRYFINGLNTNIAVSKRIPQLTDYKQEEVVQGYKTFFFQTTESINRLSDSDKPSKFILKQLVEHPNYFAPNFYESLIKQIEPDSYLNKTSIFRAIYRAPKSAEQILKNNNQTFERIKSALLNKKPIPVIDYAVIRQVVDQEPGKDVDSYIDSIYGYSINLTTDDLAAKCRKAAHTISLLTHPIPDSGYKPKETRKYTKRPKNETNQQIIKLETKLQEQNRLIQSLRRKIRDMTKKNQKLSQDLTAKNKVPDQLQTSSSRINLDSRLSTVQPQKEKPSIINIVPSHPIDYVISEKLTIEQLHTIEDLKAKKLDNSFAQDWIIEYFVVHYPDNPEEKLREAEKTLIKWKENLSNDDFKDNWILKYFITYYPNSYNDRYVKSETAFKYLTAKYSNYEFANPNFLKHVAIYYCDKRTEAMERAKQLYFELKNKFLTTELINYNFSILTLYIIRNLNDPENDLIKANNLFRLILDESIKDSKNIFHSNGKNELKTEEYLRLLFTTSPLPSNSLINNIQKAYQQLETVYADDDFFGEYKKFVFKKIAILYTEKPILNYNKYVFSINYRLNRTKNEGVDRNIIIQRFLGIPENKILK